ncbi:SAM-dependent methyltransferase [Streptomyces melanogenes]|uniref:SAM-dependent methyltransferase n=1 Tax=Streptomyces melanogenes TaxID=67326 RepID=UPI00167CDEC5|nr:class I SAM-dependent methyltransferase [Streptomyces melanogenes]GGP95223.1 hypothetical protein GCM10010278_86280 [Streptomyces melanogenes]
MNTDSTAQRHQADCSPFDSHAADVREYFEAMNDTILQDIGYTYQVGTLRAHAGDAYRATNEYAAQRIRLRPGMRVLDAGCGTCGPAVDISEHVGALTIDAVTISPAQAASARSHIEERGLGDRIRVHVGDYHRLPFAEQSFDAAYLLESACYSPNLEALFREIFRVLKPARSLYVKDVFAEDRTLSAIESEALAACGKLYRYTPQTIAHYIRAMTHAGFIQAQAGNADLWGHAMYAKAMIKYRYGEPTRIPSGAPELTDFGRAHNYHHALAGVTPLFSCDITASRPPRPQ